MSAIFAHYGLAESLLREYFILGFSVSLIVLLTHFTGKIEILNKLKFFTYMFSLLKYSYLVGFGDVILEIPYVVFKHTVVIPWHGLN